MYRRKLESIILELLQEFRIVYLTGPRQAGKTSLAKIIPENYDFEYISFDNENIRQSAENDPIGFIETYKDKKLILDEFQYIPKLVLAIKSVSDGLDIGEKGKFLLTGSANVFRSAKVQESLPGHMTRLELYPLSLAEIVDAKINVIDVLCNKKFNISTLAQLTKADLANLIFRGGYPEVQNQGLRARHMWYKSYIAGRLFKDFRTLYNARGEYQEKLNALIPYLAGLSGNLLKHSNIANDIGQNDKIVKSYIETLELMFIVKTVPGYLRNKAKRYTIAMPKLHFIDTGLACSLIGIKNEKQLVDSIHFDGLLENFIFMDLVKQNTWSDCQVELFHFRDKYQNEVDIVLEQDDGTIIGIEIKVSSSLKVRDFAGLKKLAAFAPKQFKYGVIFYTGKDILPFSQDGVELYALPMGLFLADVADS